MRILVGYVTRLHSSGVDKYLLGVLHIAEQQGVTLDFLTSQYDADTDRELQERGCRLFTVSSLKNPLAHYRDVKAVLQSGEYDKAYFNISEPLNMMGAKAAHDCGVPCIVHAHSSGMDTASALKRLVRGAINALCRPLLTRSADLYLACSRKAGEWMYTPRALRSDRYQTIYNAVDTAAFAPDPAARAATRQALGIGEDTLVVGHIGSYCYAKNNFFLADIAKELAALAPDAVMLCIGDGTDHAAVQQYAAAIGADKSMRFLGVRRDVSALLAAMDVFVLPSRFEGAPIVAVEAQAACVPCLISDRVTDEVVIAATTEQLPIDSAAPWAQHILALSRRRDEAGILPAMTDRYSIDRQQQQIINVLF